MLYFFRYLDRDKVQALTIENNNYDAEMLLSEFSRNEIIWWKKNEKWIRDPKVDFYLETDASKAGQERFYLEKTKETRKTNKLLVSYKTFKEVSTSTVARWLKEILKKPGIDEKVFSAHSYRSASTSAAFAGGVQLKDILETANLSNAKTFYTFYKRELSNNFSDTILSSSRC